jgi:Skp family chaperone for outer membrane proteins
VTTWRVLPLPLLLLAACAGPRAAPPVATPPDDEESAVRLAEVQVQVGAHKEAARLFDEIARDPGSAFADRALLGLTRILCNPEYAGRDYAQAYVVADRLVHDYPGSPYASEGRAWRELLVAYLALEQEFAQRTAELHQLIRTDEQRTQELERLKRLDAELDRRTRELERRTQELERLRRLDAELDRRTRELERRTQELERLKRLDLELEQRQRKP